MSKFAPLLVAFVCVCASAVEFTEAPKRDAMKISPASNEAETAIQKFKLAENVKIEVFAAEPDCANIVAISFDNDGKLYVCETFRINEGVLDNRSFSGKAEPLDEDLASKSPEDRLALVKRFRMGEYAKLSGVTERIRLVQDTNGDGKADKATVFADNMSTVLDGTAEGVLAYKGNVWFANIPNFWYFKDTDGDGKADIRRSLHYGYGVRYAFQGHDSHGVKVGPDGRIYFSIGDRGAHIKLAGGKSIDLTECGAVFRCNFDGSDLEIVHTGLRNPQSLAFDKFGNLFTGDNNSDAGDKARWVQICEGGDSGWRIGYQLIGKPAQRGPWNSETMWAPQNELQANFIVPPIANITNGPSGVAYYPGTGLQDKYKDHFFLCDFRGGKGSCVHSFYLTPKGASYELKENGKIIEDILATDCVFGPDGGLYVSDWVEGWRGTGKGRVYRLFNADAVAQDVAKETKKLLNGGLARHTPADLEKLLAHADMRVRMEAQFELVARGMESIARLSSVAAKNDNLYARLHAIWGLEQIARAGTPAALDAVVPLLADAEPEVRGQAAKVLGDHKIPAAFEGMLKLLKDSSPRAQYFAAISAGKFGRTEAIAPLCDLLKANDNKDPYIRHAAVQGLFNVGDVEGVLKHMNHESAAVRLGVLLLLRRFERAEVGEFLKDKDPRVVLEAARAINDIPIRGCLPELAALIEKPVDSYPLMSRSIAANLRWGTADCAKRLVDLAAKSDASAVLRTEALTALGQWPGTTGRDPITGNWRPTMHPRDVKAAAEALQPQLVQIARGAPTSVRVAALQAADKLGSGGSGEVFVELVGDTNTPLSVRIEALRTLASRKDPKLSDAMKICLTDPSGSLRREAALALVKINPSEAATMLESVLESGFISDQKFAITNLAGLPDGKADELIGRWLDNAIAGKVPKEVLFDVLDAGQKRNKPEMKEKLAKYDAARPKDDPLANFREVLYGGNSGQGRTTFMDKQETQCMRCHTVRGRGGDVGPDLSSIGFQTREYILEGIVNPNKQIAKGFEQVTVRFGETNKVAVGTIKSESETELVLNTVTEGYVKIPKNEIKMRKVGLSGMPEDVWEKLSKQELRNIVEYLAGQKRDDPNKKDEKKDEKKTDEKAKDAKEKS